MGDADEGRPSKSAGKREAQRVRKLAEYLVALPRQAHDTLVDSDLAAAAVLAADLKKGAARRQTLRVAALLRQCPEACERIDAHRVDGENSLRAAARAFRRIERLRERFLAGESAADTELKSLGGENDWQQLSDLRAEYQQATHDRRRRGAYRQLFRLIATLLERDDIG